MAPCANTEVRRQEAPRAAQPLLRSPNSNPTVVPPFRIDYQPPEKAWEMSMQQQVGFEMLTADIGLVMLVIFLAFRSLSNIQYLDKDHQTMMVRK